MNAMRPLIQNLVSIVGTAIFTIIATGAIIQCNSTEVLRDYNRNVMIKNIQEDKAISVNRTIQSSQSGRTSWLRQTQISCKIPKVCLFFGSAWFHRDCRCMRNSTYADSFLLLLFSSLMLNGRLLHRIL